MAKKLKTTTEKVPAHAPDSIPRTKPKAKPKPSESVVAPNNKIKNGKKKDVEAVGDDVHDMELEKKQKNKKVKVSEGLSEVGNGKKAKSSRVVSAHAKPKDDHKVTPAKTQKNGRKPAVIHVQPEEAEEEGSEDDDEWHGIGEQHEVKPSPDTNKQPTKPKSLVEKKFPAEQLSSKQKNLQSALKRAADVDEDADDDEDDDDVYLHGFSSDSQDSSDEDDMADDAPPLDVQKLPTVAKDDKVVKQKLDKAKRQPTEDRGVVYLARIPHGFYEDQMRAYFTQFGDVGRVRLSRNRKTGRSKHYGYIEFESSRVAEIVAETMDNYLLMGHILRCNVIPKNEVHPELWVGANKKFKVIPRALLESDAQNKPRTKKEQTKAGERLIRRQQLKKRKLDEKGIEYDFDIAAYSKRTKTTKS